MEGIIFLRQVVEKIKLVEGQAVAFNCEYRTLNMQNKQGGVLKVYKGIRLLVGQKLQGREFKAHEHFFRVYRDRKAPNHWANATLNFETATGRIVKMKLRHIIKFNGLEVGY